MADNEFVEDATIDGLESGSWLGGAFKGVLVGALLTGAGVVALSLSQPLPDHLPGVGSVKVVNAPAAPTQAEPAKSDEADAADAPKTAPEEEPGPEPAASPEDTATPEDPAPSEANTQDDPAQPDAPQPDTAEIETSEATGSVDAGQSDADAPDNTPVPQAEPDPPAEERAETDAESSVEPEQPAQEASGVTSTEDVPESSDTFEVATLPPPEDETPEPAAAEEQPAPEITLDGKALEVNARTFEGPANAPLMSVVLIGAAAAVQPEALALLTMPLTLSITPNDAEGRDLATVARAAGHEILAELPMAEGGASDPGLMAPGQAEDVLAAQTVASLALLDVAVGATAPIGADLLQDVASMRAVLGPVAEHGFAWVDPKIGAGSAARSVATAEGAAWTASDRVVAPDATEEQIYQNLESASFQARRQGSTVVFVTAGQPALKALLRWGLERGGQEVWFAPISAVIAKRSAE